MPLAIDHTLLLDPLPRGFVFLHSLLVFCYAVSLTQLFLCALDSTGSPPLMPSTIHSFFRFISSLYHTILFSPYAFSVYIFGIHAPSISLVPVRSNTSHMSLAELHSA